MKVNDQQLRLRQFWGITVFSLGVFWGTANLVYYPVAALTSVRGSSWFEGIIILFGGLLTFCASIGAFYRRGFAACILLVGGLLLLVAVVIGQKILQSTHGIINVLLLYCSGGTAFLLGLFGEITERKRWPRLREE